MSNEGIEVKLVLDVETLDIPDASDMVDEVIESNSFENAVDSLCESWFEGSNVYYHEDRLDSLESRLDDMDKESDQMQNDLNRDDEDIHTAIAKIQDIKDRLDTVEDKLSTEPEDSGNSVAMLILRVDRLEQINERLAHIIKNIQGVEVN